MGDYLRILAVQVRGADVIGVTVGVHEVRDLLVGTTDEEERLVVPFCYHVGSETEVFEGPARGANGKAFGGGGEGGEDFGMVGGHGGRMLVVVLHRLVYMWFVDMAGSKQSV
jgi:hypothetical protein